MRLPLALAALMMVTPVMAQEARLFDCYAEVNGYRVIDGPCQVTKEPTQGYGNTYDIKMVTSDDNGNVYWFFDIRETDFSTTISWNGHPGEEKDVIPLGNTYTKSELSQYIPDKCRMNNNSEICIWDKNDRPVSMGNSKKQYLPQAYVFDWNSFIPHYNVNNNCSIISSNKDRLRECIDAEQDSYNDIKENWQDIDIKAKLKCSHIANIRPWENYQQMRGCLMQEMKDRMRSDPIPQFKE